ncbi:unnamed protein product [Vitrella brassicaformis CCMP3155]|uniref:Uncharacterized protein n=2 Tax=Vitrella brassicaformis TaxID=1169539 RepID=A0A0G4EYS2_VITBC|nr:unnamed protein product [Vitrella brassicaformis CCMP3155]|mmetsp:Transcript_5564/g.13240  ORF Transcript_5564/g.13240 Transcript_5564/m.13240 type:complete len:468 (+) Transcript_5564:78-1481(+)|eukprot:CEM04510.1 unnamed protein product [Vitrella brassicaformis CCMP3155]
MGIDDVLSEINLWILDSDNFRQRPKTNYFLLGSSFDKVRADIHQVLEDLDILEGSPRKGRRHEWAEMAIAYSASVLRQGSDTKRRFQDKLRAFACWTLTLHLFDILVDSATVQQISAQKVKDILTAAWTGSKTFTDVIGVGVDGGVQEVTAEEVFLYGLFRLMAKTRALLDELHLPGEAYPIVLQQSLNHVDGRMAACDMTSTETYCAWRANHSKYKYATTVALVLRADALGLTDSPLTYIKEPIFQAVLPGAAQAASLLEDVLNYVRGVPSELNIIRIFEGSSGGAMADATPSHSDRAALKGVELINKGIQQVIDVVTAEVSAVSEGTPSTASMAVSEDGEASPTAGGIEALADKQRKLEALTRVVCETLTGCTTYYYTQGQYRGAWLVLESIFGDAEYLSKIAMKGGFVTIRRSTTAPNLKGMMAVSGIASSFVEPNVALNKTYRLPISHPPASASAPQDVTMKA